MPRVMGSMLNWWVADNWIIFIIIFFIYLFIIFLLFLLFSIMRERNYSIPYGIEQCQLRN